MPDDKQKRENRDRLRVSRNEDFEVQYLSEKFKVEMTIVRKAIEEVGSNREDLEEFLTQYKKGQGI